jgi:glucose-1-phosphate thymidylyltransferase
VKALVLAGGSGTRLRPFSHSMPKQLVPVANKPVLAHCLEALAEAGLREVGIIVRSTGREIQAEIGNGSQFGLEITYLPQERPLGLAHCVALARDFLADDDFVMYLGDNVLVGGIVALAEQFATRRPSAQVVVTRVPDPREYGVAEVDEAGWVTALVEKPANPRSDLALIGVYFFTPEIHEAVAAIEPSRRGEYEITDAIDWLVRAGRRVSASVYNGYWKDTGRIADVLECNRVLLERVAPRVDGDVDTCSEVAGPVVIEAGAKIVRSRVVGPAIIGANCVVEDSFIGPYTALSRDCLLSGAGVEYSILLDGATVHQVLGIHGSVIGRNAHVRSVPDAGRHRLVLGDHTDVEIVAPRSW